MSDLKSFIKTFYSYLKYEKRYSNDTLKNYSLDLNKFFTYLSSKKVVKVTEINTDVIQKYINSLNRS